MLGLDATPVAKNSSPADVKVAVESFSNVIPFEKAVVHFQEQARLAALRKIIRRSEEVQEG